MMKNSFSKNLLLELRRQPSLKSKIVLIIYRMSTLSRKKGVLGKLAYPFHILNVLLNQFIFSVEIPSSTKIGQGLIIYHPYAIVIHGGVTIGDNFSIRQSTTIGSAAGLEIITTAIGDNVSVGAGAIIIGDDIVIGDNVTIGAGTVVTKSIESNLTVVGSGFRILKDKSEE